MNDLISGINAAASCILAIVTSLYVVFTYRILRANQQAVTTMQTEMQQEKSFRIREHFLIGISTIAQYDIDTPGCEQALRLLDYYSWIALSSNDPDLFLILNIVMTAEIRKKLEEIRDNNKDIYIHAVEARNRIQAMLKESHMKRKGLIPKTQ